MNLTKLFEMQKALDEKIAKEKGLVGQDLLPKKILAMQVELGELANEWRGFKFWSKDQTPRTVYRESASFNHAVMIENPHRNPLLEEYVDCMHFILSIGLEINVSEIGGLAADTRSDIIYTFMECSECLIAVMNLNIEGSIMESVAYVDLFEKFLGLGEQLGFTWEQIEAAYIAKNEVNHSRQANGY